MFHTKKALVTSLSLTVVLAAAVAIVIQTGRDARRSEIQFRQMRQISGDASGNAIATSSASPRLSSLNHSNGRPEVVSSERVQQLGFQLIDSPNPKVREDIANTFGKIATGQNASSTEPGPQEPKMIDMLQAAYSQERDPSVRRAIVANAAAFNHPAALALIDNAAATDLDPSVRQAAAKARKAREDRLVLAGAQEYPTKTWR